MVKTLVVDDDNDTNVDGNDNDDNDNDDNDDGNDYDDNDNDDNHEKLEEDRLKETLLVELFR